MTNVWVLVVMDKLENGVRAFKSETAARDALFEIVEGILGDGDREFRPDPDSSIDAILEKLGESDRAGAAIILCEEVQVEE